MDADRQAIVDVVVQYATGVDRRDWQLFRACFTDPCEIDFSSWSGQPATVMAADDWVKKVRGTNGNFDATQHLSTNHVVTMHTAEATCASYMHAQHWLSARRLAELGHPNGDEPRWCTLGGHYTNSLIRTGEGWRIRRCQLDVTWITGDPSIFDIARSLGDRGEESQWSTSPTC